MIGRPLAYALALGLLACTGATAAPFEGRIEAVITRGNNQTPILYTVGLAMMRVEIVNSKTAEPINLVDLKSGALTLVLPRNQSYVQVKNTNVPAPAAARPMPILTDKMAGAQHPAVMPSMPMPGSAQAILKPTGQKEKILGFDCERFEVSERGETIEVWVTPALVPFQNYTRDAAPQFGPRQLEEQWAAQMATQKLFPLRAVLHDETPNERWRFEVTSITPEKMTEQEGKLFRPPPAYTETPPLPFPGR